MCNQYELKILGENIGGCIPEKLEAFINVTIN
jgi:hypothetical protein